MKKQYTAEFKKQAVDLAESMESISKAARQLGIRDVNIHAWKKKLSSSKAEVKASDRTQSESEELARLRKETAEQKQVIYILKRAAAFFSQDHLK